MVPDAQRFISKRVQESNWLQAMEGGIDSSHVSWLHRDNINKDGIEDLEVCFTDRAKQGTYSTQQALLVTRYSSSSYVVALRFEVNGCEAY